MAEYIKREAFVNVIDREIAQCHSEFIRSELEYLKAIIPMYTADVVERKRGEWVGKCTTGFHQAFCTVFVCSECGAKYRVPSMNFCPNCGADMRGEGDGRKHEH